MTHATTDQERAREIEAMNDAQIKHMVDRFLAWRLPADFSPDGGISFRPTYNENTLRPMPNEPTGTNLFDATQAEAMVRHMLDRLPVSSASAPRKDAGAAASDSEDVLDAMKRDLREMLTEIADNLDEFARQKGWSSIGPELLEALKLHIAYEATPTDRGGTNGRKDRAWTAFVKARDTAIAKAEALSRPAPKGEDWK